MKHLASVVLIGSALLAGSASVRAADLPLKAPPPPPPPLSWTGFYVGGNLGAVRGNADYDPVCPAFNAATCPVLFPFFAFNQNIPVIGPIITFVPAAFATLPGGGAHDISFLAGGQAGPGGPGGPGGRGGPGGPGGRGGRPPGPPPGDDGMGPPPRD